MKQLFYLALLVSLLSCGKSAKYDATGSFEADEVIVSSELAGKIQALNLDEGDTLSGGKVVGAIDAENIELQKQQVEASIEALSQKTADVSPQVQLLADQLAVQQSQLTNLQHERTRIENLLKQDAATGKQLDDINAQIDVVQRQMNVTRQQIKV